MLIHWKQRKGQDQPACNKTPTATTQHGGQGDSRRAAETYNDRRGCVIHVDSLKKIQDIQIAPCLDNHSVKWRNMVNQITKKHLMMELLFGMVGTSNGTIGQISSIVSRSIIG